MLAQVLFNIMDTFTIVYRKHVHRKSQIYKRQHLLSVVSDGLLLRTLCAACPLLKAVHTRFRLLVRPTGPSDLLLFGLVLILLLQGG